MVPNDPMPSPSLLQPLPSLPQSPSPPPALPPLVSPPVPPTSPTTPSSPASLGNAVTLPATADPTPGSPNSRSDPLQALHALPTPHEGPLDVTYIYPQVSLEVVSSTPAASQRPLAIVPDAAPSPPTAESTSGGPDSRSGPLPAPHALLTPHEGLLDVTYIHPQGSLEVMSSTPAASPHPLVVAPDAAPSPPTAESTSGGPDSRSDPLPAPHALLAPHEGLLDVTYIYPQVSLEVMSSTPAASQHPLVVAPDAALSPPTAESTSGGPDTRSDPLPAPHALLAPHEGLLDVTYIYPQVSLEVMSSTPAASQHPLVVAPNAALSPPTAESTSGGPDTRSDPLPAPHALLAPHEGLLDVTYIYPRVSLEVMSSTPAASQRPLAVAPDAAPLPATADPTSGGPDSRSGPLPAPHALFTPHEGLLDVTYIHPQVPLEVMPVTPATSPHPLVVAPGAAPSPPIAEPTSGGPGSRSDPLPPLHALLTSDEDLLGVTYVQPQPPLETRSSMPSAPPQPPVTSPDVVPPPAVRRARPLVVQMDVPTPRRLCMRFSLQIKIR